MDGAGRQTFRMDAPGNSRQTIRMDAPQEMQVELGKRKSVRQAEKRVARDGNEYTWQEFIDHFGKEDGEFQWNNASKPRQRGLTFSDESKPRPRGITFSDETEGDSWNSEDGKDGRLARTTI